jgi:hypothetical protein
MNKYVSPNLIAYCKRTDCRRTSVLGFDGSGNLIASAELKPLVAGWQRHQRTGRINWCASPDGKQLNPLSEIFMKTYSSTLSLLAAALLVCITTLCLPRLAYAAAPLFTAAEVDNWNKQLPQAAPTFKSRDLNTRGMEVEGPSCHSIPKTDAPASPTIDIVSPVLDKPLATPLDINVKFIAAGAEVIQPNTFRLCYMARFMTIDITDKIADKVTVLPEGLHVAGADLPSGHHHLIMLIGDRDGHIGRREATFDIK